ncbi:SDR family NAD(P)-dependent oxidoreductase [Aneurinibacillus tyrosinisolvens]|uniref:SDR family NAD(P)-dependent oxidoreductase n=1 Tax=Aneurinibacillus tyrosinisolvens TaxID=1443435 RepID=UPI00069C9A3D|nr:SDR family NAD(P)-dependent oxidoreductase [Aneurinibacillus tyrosinisolvens]
MLTDEFDVIALIRSDFTDEPLISKSISKGKLRVYKADLTDYASLKTSLKQIKGKEEKIDVLFNNAGNSLPELITSKQGREMHYELMTVVPYIILMELKPLILEGSMKMVVNTSSKAANVIKNFNPDTLERPTTFKKLVGPYASSKLALSLWTQEIFWLKVKQRNYIFLSMDERY